VAEDDGDPDWFERATERDDDADADRADQPGETDDPDSPDGTAEPDDTGAGNADADAEAGADDGDGDLFSGDFEEELRGAGEGPFDEDFGAALGDAGETGMPSGESSFEEDEYGTDIPRIDVGIEGLDDMIQGGIPDRSLIAAIGGAGTGKTTLGLQFLAEGLENGDRAVFIALEESRDRILSTADDKGLEFERYVEEGQLAIVDLDPVEMANSLGNIQDELPALIEEFDAARLVLDSVSLLEMMYDDQATRRTEVYDFARALKNAGVTTLVTSEASDDTAFASRFGIIEYLVDAVFVLRYIRPDDFQETRLAIEIQKIRDANHSRETKPYEMTSEGISVYQQATIF
jgi:KaiC domain protein